MKLLNKAAMFGFRRMLRKQSGGLFLMSSQSVVSKETRVEHQFKRAAMFGLDARIALAIFGALSVISGAALYSAIQSSKVTAFITYANEVGKAWEQFYLDTGTKLTYTNSNTSDPYYYYRKVADLINDPNITDWKGPYLQETVIQPYAISNSNKNIDTTAIAYMYNPNGSGLGNVYCVSGIKNCGLWLQFYRASGIPRSFIDSLDMRIDGELGATTGNFRWIGSPTYFFIKYMSVPNPID